MMPSGAAADKPAADRISAISSTADAIAGVSFNTKRWVWIPDPADGYVSAHIVAENGEDSVTVEVERTLEQKVVSINDTQKMNPPKMEKVADMSELAHLNEASVVHNLRMRYLSNMIYTYSGLFLVAINPFQNIPLYTDQIIAAYRNKRRNEVAPHIFTIVDNAYRNMVQSHENQSILITGESGAGKTESTKKVIQYLSVISGESSTQQGQSRRQNRFTEANLDLQILQANPIMESFGNAQTIRNNNSSRFGKFIRIEFSASGQICGANIEKYLLEKSRVTHQTSEERNYHIFYQLISGAPAALKKRLLIENDDYSSFNYLKKSNKEIAGVDDAQDFAALERSLEIIGFSDEDRFDFYKVVVAILMFGNITCKGEKTANAVIDSAQVCEKICHLLGIKADKLIDGLTRPKIKAGRDYVVQSRTHEQVLSSVDSLARAMYDRMFTKLIERINRALDRSKASASFIGVLDIAGFEIFENNSFEQLCINFTNECLQQFFNTQMFKNEQEEYRRENIEWKMIDFGLDLQPTIDLIQKPNPVGVFSCLDEECVMPKATDKTFTDKLVTLWREKSPKFDTVRFFDGFVIQHYAGRVEYRTEGWLEKNKDPLNETVTKLLAESSDKFISDLFAEYSSATPVDDLRGKVGGGVKKGAFRTVAQKHKEQLTMLMNLLNSTQPHFVRCIVPNHEKKPNKIDVHLVLEQLRCNGVLEGIRICRAGFPNRLPFAQFRQKFEILCSGAIPKGFMDGHKATSILLEKMGVDPSQYRIGLSKVFFRTGVLQELEEVRDQKLAKTFTSLQALCRGYLMRNKHQKRLEQLKAVRILQRNVRAYNMLREWHWYNVFAKLKPMLQVGRVEEEMRRKDTAITELKVEIANEREEKLRLEDLMNQLEAQRIEIEAQLVKDQQTATDRESLLSNAQDRIAALQVEIQELQAQYNELVRNHEDTVAAQAALAKNLDTVNASLEERNSALEAAEKSVCHKEDLIKKLESQVEENLARVQALETEKSNLSSTVNELKSQIEQGAAAENEIRKSKRSIESSLSESEERIAALEREVAALTQRKNILEAELLKSQSAFNDLDSVRNELETQLKKKQFESESLSEELAKEQAQREALEKTKRELTLKNDDLEAHLEAEIHAKTRALDNWKRLQEEFDGMRQIVDDKTDLESKNSEDRRVRELELKTLHTQLQQLRDENAENKRKHASNIDALRSECDQLINDNEAAKKEKQRLERAIAELNQEIEESSDVRGKIDRQKRELEAKCSAQANSISELEDKIAQLVANVESLEKNASNASSKVSESQTVIENYEREIQKSKRTIESLNENIEELTKAREQSETHRRRLNTEQSDLQGKLDQMEIDNEELNRKLTAKTRELEVLKEKFNAEGVVRVNELEQARKKLDSELADLNARLKDVEEAEMKLKRDKARLETELEDRSVELERLQTASRSSDKQQRTLESEIRSLNSALESETMKRELAESKQIALQGSIDSLQHELGDRVQTISTLQSSKSNLENELKNLIDQIGAGGKSVHELEKTKRKLEQQSAELRESLEENLFELRKSEDARRDAEEQLARFRLRTEKETKEREAQFEETKQMLLNEVNNLGLQLDEEIAAKSELAKARKRLEAEIAEMSSKEDHSSKSKTDLEKAKKKLEAQFRELQTRFEEEERTRKNYAEMAQRFEKRVSELSQDFEEQQLVIENNEREKKRMERRIEDLTNELEGGEGGSKVQLLENKRKLEKEISNLRLELEQEVDARIALEVQRASEPAESEAIRGKFREDYEKQIEAAEESRRALVAAQRLAQNELDLKQREIETLEKQKKAAQNEVSTLQQQLDEEAALKVEESAQKRKLMTENKELHVLLEQSQAKIQELNGIIELNKSRADSSMAKLENSELMRLKSEKAESSLRLKQKELEDDLEQANADRHSLEERLRTLENKFTELKSKAEDDSSDLTEALDARRKIANELEEVRARSAREQEELELQLDTLRRRQQTQVSELSNELDDAKRSLNSAKDEVQRLTHDLEVASSRLEEETRSKALIVRERERMESKLNEMSKQYNELVSTCEEQRDQISKSMTQIRTLRNEVHENEAQSVALEKMRRSMEAKIAELTELYDEASKARDSLQSQFSTLDSEASRLRQQQEELEDDLQLLKEKYSRTDLALQQSTSDLARQKELTSDAERQKANHERNAKELMMRVVELETSALGEGGKSVARMQTRIQELSAQLENEIKEKEEALRTNTRNERVRRDLLQQVSDRDKQRQRVEEDLERMKQRSQKLKMQCEEMEARETSVLIERRRLERELDEAKERVTQLEMESKRAAAKPRN